MSTCPRCFGHLSTGHRCRGAWRRWLEALRGALVAAVIGGTLGALVLGQLGAMTMGESFAVVGFIAGLVTWLLAREQLRHRY